jgi:hypothetical protein
MARNDLPPQRHKLASSLRFVGWTLVVLLFGSWLVSHIVFCCQALHLEQDLDGKKLSVLVLLNLGVLGLVLHRKMRPGPAGNRNSQLGSFILGVTPLGITVLAFATASAQPREYLNDRESKVSLHDKRPSIEKKIAFFIGIDISKSALPTSGETEANILKAVELLMYPSERPYDPRPISAQANLRAFSLGKTTQPIDLKNGDFGAAKFAEDVALIAKTEIQRARKVVRGEREAETDVVGFLAAIQPEVELSLASNDYVAIIIISDFLQDRNLVSFSGERSFAERVAQSYRGLNKEHSERRRVQTSSRVASPVLTLLGVKVERQEDPTKKANPGEDSPLDLTDRLRTDLFEIWNEVPLAELLSEEGLSDARLDLQSILSAELRVDIEKTLYIKYIPSDPSRKRSWVEGIISPREKNQQLALQLRTGSDFGQGPQRVAISVGRAEQPGVLLPVAERSTDWRPIENDEKGLSFELINRPDVSRAVELQLLIAAPALRVVYVVPVVVLPVASKMTATAYKILVLSFMFLVLLFVFFEFWTGIERFRWFRKRLHSIERFLGVTE